LFAAGTDSAVGAQVARNNRTKVVTIACNRLPDFSGPVVTAITVRHSKSATCYRLLEGRFGANCSLRLAKGLSATNRRHELRAKAFGRFPGRPRSALAPNESKNQQAQKDRHKGARHPIQEGIIRCHVGYIAFGELFGSHVVDSNVL
jgi:hypothetical protein